MIDMDTRDRFRVFLEHAGWSTPPGRAACALNLARAEQLLDDATGLGVAEVTWEYDDAPYDVHSLTDDEVSRLFDSGEWTGPFGCTLTIEDETVASLWGVVVGPKGFGDPYCRVVAAELASEHEDELRQAIARDAALA